MLSCDKSYSSFLQQKIEFILHAFPKISIRLRVEQLSHYTTYHNYYVSFFNNDNTQNVECRNLNIITSKS